MKTKELRKKNRIYNLYIAMWVVPLILVELIVLLNYLTKGNKFIFGTYFLNMLFVIVVFAPGIIFNFIIKKKDAFHNKKRGFWFFFIQLAFMGCSFIGLVEAGLDASKTTEQVKQVIEIIKGTKKTIYLEEIGIELEIKDEYYIGDVIDFNIKYTPSKATEKDLLVEISNNIVNVDLENNKIECLENGECTITFTDSHNKKATDSITIRINSVTLDKIVLNKNKDIFIDINEEYQLTPELIPVNSENVELKYTSSDTSIAVVNEAGIVLGIKPGTVRIDCYDNDVRDSVYVTVAPITEFSLDWQNIELEAGYENRTYLKLAPDQIESYNPAYLTVKSSSNYDVDILIEGIDLVNKNIPILFINHEEQLYGNKNIEITIDYTYPGGHKITNKVKIKLMGDTLLNYKDIDFAKTKTNYDFTIFHDGNDNLISKYIEIPIFYTLDTSKYLDNFYIKEQNNKQIDYSYSKQDKIVLYFEEFNLLENEYIIEFYPNKDIMDDEHVIVFNITLNKNQIVNPNTNFEFSYLYEDCENKKNEIWYSYFDEKLFNNYSFEDVNLQNSGLVFFFNEEFLDKVDIELDDYGYVTKANLKDKINNWYIKEEMKLEFSVCSKYEYDKDVNCPKKTYTIDVKKEFNSLLVSVNNGPYLESISDIVIKKGEQIKFDCKCVVDLEYKGDFQEDFEHSNYIFNSDDLEVAFIGNGIIKGIEYGITTGSIGYNKLYVNNTFEKEFEIKVVNELGIVPTENYIQYHVESFDNCKPDLENEIFATGTILEFSMYFGSNFEFTSSNTNIFEFSGSNVGKCIGSGEVSIIATNNSNPNEKFLITFKVYEDVKKIELLKGGFIEISSSNNVYYLQAKTNKRYLFTFSNDQNYEFVNVDENKDLVLDENGGIVMVKAGTYHVLVTVGEEDSPYKTSQYVVITVTDDGITNNFKFFIRKAIGHFGLFFVTGVFASIALLFMNCFKIRNKIFALLYTLGFGIFLAFSTEYMQKTDPSRYCSFSDILLDCYGYFSAFIIILIIYCLNSLRKNKLNKK
ncbi:MAG: Ig-like domain-containing protein [Bacilli bacterium]|nr:Ig-like domain-containing protein [Bacilli bacterium]